MLTKDKPLPLRRLCISTIIKSKKALTVKVITARLDNTFTADQVRKSLARCVQEGLLRIYDQVGATREKLYISTSAGRALINDAPTEEVLELKVKEKAAYKKYEGMGAGKCLLQELWKGPYVQATAQT